MAKRRNRQGVSGNPAKRAQADGAGFAMSSAMFRRNCPECGSDVRWVSPVEAAEAGFDIADGLAFLGSAADDVDIWLCSQWPDCDGAGLMPRQFEGEWYGDSPNPFA